jgi:lysozyme
MLVRESINRFMMLNEDFLAENILNEKININSIVDTSKKLGVLASMFLMFANSKTSEMTLPNKDLISKEPVIINMSQEDFLSRDEIFTEFETLLNLYRKDNNLEFNILQDPLTLKVTNNCINIIKKHEGLRLKAYSLKDNRITIGYGHAEPIKTSKYRLGDKISKEEAERLLIQDIKKKERDVKRIFKQWQDSGINIKISHNMFDALVSITYNVGTTALRTSEMIQLLKRKDYFGAAERILTTKINKKYPGLKKRRAEEAELFIKGFS